MSTLHQRLIALTTSGNPKLEALIAHPHSFQLRPKLESEACIVMSAYSNNFQKKCSDQGLDPEVLGFGVLGFWFRVVGGSISVARVGQGKDGTKARLNGKTNSANP